VARRTVVKVCGLTRLEDAREAVRAGADWLGMILAPESPRAIGAAAAREIALALDGVTSVAVLVRPTPVEAAEVARRTGVARLQLHGVDPLRWPRDFPVPVGFVVPVAEDGALVAALPDPRDLTILDTHDPARAGGTGRAFPWASARVVAATRDVMLAGGLAADNVAAALAAVEPFGVDASSRLESAPGIKDAAKVRAFVAAVRAFDTEAGEGA